MAKVLEIVGASKKLIIDDCAKCPLQYRISGYREECHHPDLEGRFAESGSICYLCPLPDATEAPTDVWPDDENHRLGPNGERLIAVESVPTSGNSILQFCAVCFCFKHSLPCFPCEKEQREDGRNIHWELAGDRT